MYIHLQCVKVNNKTIKIMETKEIFKDIPGYEGYYQVSDRGNLRSLDRTVITSRGSRTYKGRVIDGHICKTTGYRQFGLSANGKSRNFTASQLVAMAFLNHKPDGHTFVVDHINGDRSDDRLENLRIVTNRANTTTCFRKHRKILTSKYVGVHWSKHAKKWQAQIQYEGELVYLGYYDDELEASEAYQKALAKVKDNTFNSLDYKPNLEIMKTERIMIRVSKELKEQIERDANDLNLSMSNYIRMKLSK